MTNKSEISKILSRSPSPTAISTAEKIDIPRSVSPSLFAEEGDSAEVEEISAKEISDTIELSELWSRYAAPVSQGSAQLKWGLTTEEEKRDVIETSFLAIRNIKNIEESEMSLDSFGPESQLMKYVLRMSGENHLAGLMSLLARYVGLISNLDKEDLAIQLGRFPNGVEDWYCVPGVLGKLQASVLSLESVDLPVTQRIMIESHNEVINQYYLECYSYVYEGNHSHVHAAIALFLGFNTVDDMAYSTMLQIPANLLSKIYSCYEQDLEKEIEDRKITKIEGIKEFIRRHPLTFEAGSLKAKEFEESSSKSKYFVRYEDPAEYIPKDEYGYEDEEGKKITKKIITNADEYKDEDGKKLTKKANKDTQEEEYEYEDGHRLTQITKYFVNCVYENDKGDRVSPTDLVREKMWNMGLINTESEGFEIDKLISYDDEMYFKRSWRDDFQIEKDLRFAVFGEVDKDKSFSFESAAGAGAGSAAGGRGVTEEIKDISKPKNIFQDIFDPKLPEKIVDSIRSGKLEEIKNALSILAFGSSHSILGSNSGLMINVLMIMASSDEPGSYIENRANNLPKAFLELKEAIEIVVKSTETVDELTGVLEKSIEIKLLEGSYKWINNYIESYREIAYSDDPIRRRTEVNILHYNAVSLSLENDKITAIEDYLKDNSDPSLIELMQLFNTEDFNLNNFVHNPKAIEVISIFLKDSIIITDNPEENKIVTDFLYNVVFFAAKNRKIDIITCVKESLLRDLEPDSELHKIRMNFIANTLFTNRECPRGSGAYISPIQYLLEYEYEYLSKILNIKTDNDLKKISLKDMRWGYVINSLVHKEKTYSLNKILCDYVTIDTIHEIVKSNYPDAAKALIKFYSDDFAVIKRMMSSTSIENGLNPLCEAIFKNHNQIALLLVENGANPVEGSGSGVFYSPLYLAVYKENLELIDALILSISNKANRETSNQIERNKRIAQLLSIGRSDLDESPLCAAIQVGNVEIVNKLLEVYKLLTPPIEINIQEYMHALQSQNRDITKNIMQYGDGYDKLIKEKVIAESNIEYLAIILKSEQFTPRQESEILNLFIIEACRKGDLSDLLRLIKEEALDSYIATIMRQLIKNPTQENNDNLLNLIKAVQNLDKSSPLGAEFIVSRFDIILGEIENGAEYGILYQAALEKNDFAMKNISQIGNSYGNRQLINNIENFEDYRALKFIQTYFDVDVELRNSIVNNIITNVINRRTKNIIGDLWIEMGIEEVGSIIYGMIKSFITEWDHNNLRFLLNEIYDAKMSDKLSDLVREQMNNILDDPDSKDSLFATAIKSNNTNAINLLISLDISPEYFMQYLVHEGQIKSFQMMLQYVDITPYDAPLLFSIDQGGQSKEISLILYKNLYDKYGSKEAMEIFLSGVSHFLNRRLYHDGESANLIETIRAIETFIYNGEFPDAYEENIMFVAIRK